MISQDGENLVHLSMLGPSFFQSGFVHQAEGFGKGMQTLCRVVLPKHESEFGSGGKHPVGLFRPSGHQVVDHDPDKGFVTAQNHRLQALEFSRGVDAGHQALTGGLFVATGAIDLSRQEQTADGLGLQASLQLGWVYVIILDAITRLEHLCLFQSRNGTNHGHLYVLWQACGNAVGIDDPAGPVRGLQDDLVGFPLAKAHDLVFDGGTVARAHPLDDPGKERRSLKARSDDFMSPRKRAGHMANHVRQIQALRVQGERQHHRIRGLYFQFIQLQAFGQEPRRGAGFQSPQPESKALQVGAQILSRGIAHPPTGFLIQADKHHAAQESARGQNNGLRLNPAPIRQA